jgi:GMP synthase-like glutamine amidotransferase/DNA-binding NarL/FixJ family response regulator/tetratricopeptide (TPR) repeat protein
MRALVFEHLDSNPVGIYADVLTARALDVDVRRLLHGDAIPDWRRYDLIVAMGGGMSVFEEEEHPWLADEKAVIGEAVRAGLPYFGICLGSQLLAEALGGRVYRGYEPELGLHPVSLLDEASRDPVLRGFPRDLAVVEFHQDHFDLPPGAVRLAGTPRYPNQAFRVGRVAYALQCHLEPTLADMEDWCRMAPGLVAAMEARNGGGWREQFLADYAHDEMRLHATGRQLFRRWLENALVHAGPLARTRPAAGRGAPVWRGELVGRTAECDAIERLIAAARGGRGGTLAVAGADGAGKTALLGHAERRAAGLRVLRVVGDEAAADEPFAALQQLVEPLGDLLAGRSSAGARALAAAVGLREGADGDRFAVPAGLLELLVAAGRDGPVLVLVDDVHALDEPSAEAFEFAAGRLFADRVAAIAAVRPFDRRMGRFERLDLPPLADAAAEELLAASGVDLAPTVASEILALAAGNPLALTELARGLTDGQRTGREPLPQTPRELTLERLYLHRLEALPDETRAALLLAALAPLGDEPVLNRALVLAGIGPGTLAHAAGAGLITTTAGVRFAHGLVRSTVVYAAPRAERMAAHAVLARAVGDERPDQQAWHAGIAAAPVDGAAAAALDGAAARARARRAHAIEARAADLAAYVGPPGDERAHRLLTAARGARRAGHLNAALDHLAESAAEATDPLLRADAARMRGRLLARAGRAPDAASELNEAAAQMEAIDADRSAALLADAVIPLLRSGRPADALDAGRRAVSLAIAETTALAAELMLGTAMCLAGEHAEGTERIELVAGRRAEIESDADLRGYLGFALRIAGRPEAAAAVLAEAVEDARSEAAVGALPYQLLRMAQVRIDLGQWIRARAELWEALSLAREAGRAADAGLALGTLAWLAAARGRDAECRASAAEAMEISARLGQGSQLDHAGSALGLLALARGDAEEAAAELEPAVRLAASAGWSDAATPPHRTPDLVEAYAASGRTDEARALSETFADQAARTRRLSAIAAAARCRGVLAAGDAFEEPFREALSIDEQATGPFDLARTELAFGRRLAATGSDEAAERLLSALATFERLEAIPWAAQARAELTALGTATPEPVPSLVSRLTPHELSVSLAVAGGATVDDAAAQLLFGPRTVEHLLAEAHRKLGTASAGDLARVFGQPEPRAVSA